MSLVPALLYDGALGLAVGSALYGTATLTAVLVALLAGNPARRRDAREVLALLLRRPVAGLREPARRGLTGRQRTGRAVVRSPGRTTGSKT
jgi:hypothetical protein